MFFCFFLKGDLHSFVVIVRIRKIHVERICEVSGLGAHICLSMRDSRGRVRECFHGTSLKHP